MSVQIPDTFLAPPLVLTAADLEGKTLDDFTTPREKAALDQAAGPYPVHWLFPAEPGVRRVLNMFCGCGGGCVAIRTVLGARVDMVCIDYAKDVVATQRAAGCYAIQADIRTLDPTHLCLRYVTDVVASPPCTDWTGAGSGAGRIESNIEILAEAMRIVMSVTGNYFIHNDDEFDCGHDDCRGSGDHWEHHAPPSHWETGFAEARKLAATMQPAPPRRPLTEAEARKRQEALTAPLMLEPLLFVLAMKHILGAPLKTVMLEQSSKLPEQIKEDYGIELYVAGFDRVDWVDFDAATVGSPSHRVRSFMLATTELGVRPDVDAFPAEPITTIASEALGWEIGVRINTRGVRKTQGGNAFSLDRVIPGVTSKIRGWYDEEDKERKFELHEIKLLVTLPPDHPLVGSRSSQCQQAGDVIAPVAGAAILGALWRLDWEPLLRRYLATLYPRIHGRLAATSRRRTPWHSASPSPSSTTSTVRRPRAA